MARSGSAALDTGMGSSTSDASRPGFGERLNTTCILRWAPPSALQAQQSVAGSSRSTGRDRCGCACWAPKSRLYTRARLLRVHRSGGSRAACGD